MILSVSRKFLFIHIPKTAGTSIREVLEPHGVPDKARYSPGLEGYVRAKGRFPPHLSYAGAAELLAVDLSGYFKFTFVRNPWDRYVSLYEYMRKETTHPMHARCSACSYEAFIDDVVARRATFETKNQADYVAPPPRLPPLDFIGRMENLGADFATVCERLGIGSADLPVLNTTRHDHYRSYYSDALREKVARFCAPDVAAFGYEF